MLSTGSYLSHLIPKTILWSRRSFYSHFVEKEGWVCRVTRTRSCSKGWLQFGGTGSCTDKIRCSFLMYLSNYLSMHNQDSRILSPLDFPFKHCWGPTSRCPETVGVQQELRKKWSALPGQRKWVKGSELVTVNTENQACPLYQGWRNPRTESSPTANWPTPRNRLGRNPSSDLAVLRLGSWGPSMLFPLGCI